MFLYIKLSLPTQTQFNTVLSHRCVSGGSLGCRFAILPKCHWLLQLQMLHYVCTDSLQGGGGKNINEWCNVSSETWRLHFSHANACPAPTLKPPTRVNVVAGNREQDIIFHYCWLVIVCLIKGQKQKKKKHEQFKHVSKHLKRSEVY